MVKKVALLVLVGCAPVEWGLTDGPNLRTGSGACSAFDPIRRQMVVFGDSPTSVPTTWGWDGAVWHKLAVGGPAARLDCAMAYDATQQQVVMFGGVDIDILKYSASRSDRVAYATLGDTWLWDGATWRQHGEQWPEVPEESPPPTSNGAMSYHPRHGGVILYGGLGACVAADPAQGLTSTDCQATWLFDASGWHRLSPNL